MNFTDPDPHFHNLLHDHLGTDGHDVYRWMAHNHSFYPLNAYVEEMKEVNSLSKAIC